MAMHFLFSPRIRSFLLSLSVVLGGPAWGADPGLSAGTPVTFVPFNSAWKYEDTGTDLGTAWRQPAYVDALWYSGVAQLGYGDGDESAVVGFGPDATAKYITTYFRRQVRIADVASITWLRGRLLQDDGAVVYVNGVEVFRSNLPMGPISFHTMASSVSPDNQIVGFSAPASVLVEGVNVIAVEMHQVNPTSSDLSFDLELVGEVQPAFMRNYRCVGWGLGYWGARDIPTNLTNPVAVAAGQYHSMALRADGTVVIWGGNGADYETAREVPVGLNNVAAISAGWGTSLALKHDGTVVPWGVGIGSDYGYMPEEVYDVAAISAGGFFALVLRGDGKVVAWGFNDAGQIDVPPDLTNVVAISGGSHHSLALKADGTVVGWGYNGDGQAAIPPGLSNVVAIAAGSQVSVALKADGTVVTWGRDLSSFGNKPENLENIAAITAGASHVVALRQDGTVAAWGSNQSGQSQPPPGLSNVTAIASSDSHTLALVGEGFPEITVHPWNRDAQVGDMVSFAVRAVGEAPLAFQWQVDGRDIPHETNAVLTLENLPLASAGSYRAIVRNGRGSATSRVALLRVETPVNQPPAVRLTAPPDGQVFDAPADVRLEATTTDPDGYADTVEFFANDQKIGEAQVVFIQAPPPGEPIHFEFVWRNAPVGDHRLTARTRDNDGATGVSDAIHVTVRDLPSGDRELHAIGIYSGATSDGGPSRNNEPGEAFVLVNRPGKRVTLFLTAYEPVFWDITLGEGTTIERVFLSGYYRQEVLWLAPEVPVMATSYEQANGYTYLGYTLDSGRFVQALPEVCALTGMDISSFHGSYTAPHLTPIVIDGVQDDERLRCDYPQPVDPSQLPALGFRMTFYGGQIFTRDYTLAGPVNGGKLLPAMRVVADGAQRYYYGTDGPGQRQATRVDASSGAAEPIVFTPVPGDQGWEMGAAFDSRRERVLLVTLGGQGFLYGLGANDTEWSRLASMNNLDLDCLEYHPPGDALYGVEISRVDSVPPAILEFGPDGSFRRRIPLPSFPFNVSPAWHRSELVSVGDYLVLLLEPEYFNVNQPLDSRIYLIDPRSGQVWLTYRHLGIPPVPNPDTDGDGVPNDRDQCPGTSAGSVVNADGCSLAQLCPCDGPWRNHAEYVVCAIRHAWEFYRQDLISADQRRAIILGAVRSSCGRRFPAPEPPRLHALPLTAEECRRDGFQFVLSGDVPPGCAMESSTDLIHWAPFNSAETLQPGTEITCPGGTDAPMRFYRLRLEP